jgi:hypothetical protein
MDLRKLSMAMAFACISSAAMAETGTPEQQAACRPDVRRFCNKVPERAGDQAFQDCLQANRDKLSPKCQRVLMGQQP